MPMALATTMTMAAMPTETRAPYRTRLNRSRPNSSVPKRWAADGRLEGLAQRHGQGIVLGEERRGQRPGA